LDSQEATITASGDIGTLDIDFDANSNHTEAFDISTGRILTSLSFITGDEAEVDNNAFLIELTDDVEAEVGVYNLEVSIADTDGSEVIIDAEAAGDLVNIGTNTKISVLTVGETSGSYYQGSITIAGDDGDTVTLGSTAILDASALDGTGQTTGSAGTFGSWTITTGAGADTITGSPGADTITTVAGNDTITGGAGNDSITSGNGADTVTPGTGTDSVILTESVSSADIVIINTDPETATEGDSEFVTASGEGNNTGEDTITTFTAGVDTIRIVGTDVGQFVHATNTDLGDGTSSSTDDDGSEGFLTTVGLINMNAETATDDFDDDGDVVINFSSPTTTMTEALFEAALQYNMTGTDAADTITTGGLADTIKGGLGADSISGGAGVDIFILSSGLTVDTIGDFTAETDVFNIDLSDLETANAAQAATTINIIGFGAAGAAATSIAAATAEATATVTGATAHAALLNANILLLDEAAGFANVGAAVDSFENAGDATLTHQSNIAQDDAFLFAYENSTSGVVHIALANFSAADDNNAGAAVIADNVLEGIDLAQLTGVTDVTALTAVDFNFVT
jgi:Ca2+-binding RTX toxin-like protein